MSIRDKKYFEEVVQGERILATVIRKQQTDTFARSGEKFVFPTPQDFPLQYGVQNHHKGDLVEPHFHLPFAELKNLAVQEFFYVLSGSIRVDLYDELAGDKKVEEVVLGVGDAILLNTGHAVEVLEDGHFFELKQGPYRGRDEEKRYF